MAQSGNTKNKEDRKRLLSSRSLRKFVGSGDQPALVGIFAVLLLGFVFAVFEIFTTSSFSVDPPALAKERERKRFAADVTTPMPEVPFSMPKIVEPSFPDRDCPITEFGAVPGGKVLNTESIRKAIASCEQKGGGRVVVPKGLWLSGAIHLKSNINLHVEAGGKILFSNDLLEYLPPVFSRFEGIELMNYSPFIYARDATNIAITGDGELDGNGKMWQDWNKVQEPSLLRLEKLADQGAPLAERNFALAEDALQPSFVQFVRCRNILLEDIKISRSPSWTIHPVYSSDITVRHVEVYTDARNTDGIAIDSSRNVVVHDSIFRAGDDAIVIKSGKDRDGLRVREASENIVIHDVTVEDGHGAIAFGSEMSGGIRNVFVKNLTATRADFGIRFKSMRGRGGVIEDITIENMKMGRSVYEGIQVDMDYGTPLRPDDTSLSPIFRDITVRNLSIDRARTGLRIVGLPESPVENLILENISIQAEKDGVAPIHLKNEQFRNVNIIVQDRKK